MQWERVERSHNIYVYDKINFFFVFFDDSSSCIKYADMCNCVSHLDMVSLSHLAMLFSRGIRASQRIRMVNRDQRNKYSSLDLCLLLRTLTHTYVLVCVLTIMSLDYGMIFLIQFKISDTVIYVVIRKSSSPLDASFVWIFFHASETKKRKQKEKKDRFNLFCTKHLVY